MPYAHYYNAGRNAAIAGNYWLSSCPYDGWQREAWQAGNWSAR